jgi:dephospho-CoA kinase
VLGKGKTPAQDRLCQLGGTKVPLADEVLRKLYKNGEDYQSRVNARLDALIKEGWFLKEYADDVRGDARKARIP